MKKKIFSILLIAVMVLTSFSAVFADETGTITIANAAKGETYNAYKLFDATVDGSGNIAYTGTIPDSLTAFFTKDSAGNITKATGKTDAEITAAVQAWAAEQKENNVTPAATATGNGGTVTLTVPYGYYAITSSQGSVVTVDSTNPNATIYDKNTKTITAQKTVDDTDYSIGDTITYTGTFETTNYYGVGEASKPIVDYVISDTLPEFLSDVNVTSITVDGTAITTQQFDAAKEITIPWADYTNGTWVHKYNNGAKIVITYTAKLTSTVNVNAANKNTIKIEPVPGKSDGGKDPREEGKTDSTEITTYAAALKKTDGTKPLAGAQFTIKGLKVTGSAGEYTVVSYDPDGDESAVLDTNSDGKLYIIGLADEVSLVVTEYKAPNGYNKLTAPVNVPAQVLSKEVFKSSETRKYDADGNLIESTATASSTKEVTKNLTDLDATATEVVNNAGVEMPGTGGMGTTIIYILGAALVIGAGVVLVTRKKADR